MSSISGSGWGDRGGRRKRYRGGRPKVQPFIGQEWKSSNGEIVLSLSNVELETLRLVDEENLTQEQAAERMQISRGTLWRILQKARKKIVIALNSGKSHIQLSINEDQNK